MHVDLDAARAARAEKRQGSAPSITFGGREYPLVAELPVEFTELLEQGRFRLALGILLADLDDIEPFMANKPTVEDLSAIADVYGFGGGLGESPASGASSNGIGKSSRPTSKRTTGSTSGKPAGARRRPV